MDEGRMDEGRMDEGDWKEEEGVRKGGKREQAYKLDRQGEERKEGMDVAGEGRTTGGRGRGGPGNDF